MAATPRTGHAATDAPTAPTERASTATRCADASGLLRRTAFTSEERSVSRARAFVREVVAGFPAELVADAELLVSELATNAVLHGSVYGGMFGVVVRPSAGWVYVAVIDCGGRTVPQVVEAGAESVSCRGLAMVAKLAADWGVVREPGFGHRVWFGLASDRYGESVCEA